jgi:hypothetical protein
VSLNQITPAHAEAEIGSEAFAKVRNMLLEVYKQDELLPEEQWRFSYAPSIIVRSEMEMYGQSHPRFAIRLEPFRDGGFLNLRRVAEVARQLPSEWPAFPEDFLDSYRAALNQGKPEPIYNVRAVNNETDAITTPRTVFETASPVADSLLPIPVSVGESYHLTTAPPEVAAACGMSTTAPVVPYLKHIPLHGAGLCAEAVCYMGQVLHYGRIGAIHGLAEINRLAAERVDVDVTNGKLHPLHGLKTSEFAHYFKTRGFSCPKLSHVAEDDRHLALRRYLLAEIPVILPCDLGRLRGQALVQDGEMPLTVESPVYSLDGRRPTVTSPSSHAILAIGCSKTHERESKNSSLLINDPAVRPFVELTQSQWLDAFLYEPTNQGRYQRSNKRFPYFMPICHGRVDLHLIGSVPGNHGFLTQFRWIARGGAGELDDGTSFCFLSFHPADAGITLRLISGAEILTMLSETETLLVPHQLYWYCEHPIDEKGSGDCFWIWNSEFKHPVRRLLDAIVFAGLKTRTGWRRMTTVTISREQYSFDAPQTPPGRRIAPRHTSSQISAPAPDAAGSVDVGLISSFSITNNPEQLREGLDAAAAGKPLSIELYTFMHEDAQRYLGGNTGESALQLMAAGWDRYRQENGEVFVRQIAEAIAKDYDGYPIRSMATYLPEAGNTSLTGNRGLALRTQASRALAFLVVLAEQLSSLGEGHCIQTIELVGGTRISDISPVIVNDRSVEPRYLAFETNSETAISHLLDTLLETEEMVGDRMRDQHLVWALEKEPGDYYTLNGSASLKTLLRILDDASGKYRKRLRPLVGLNFDIPHWLFLCEDLGLESITIDPAIADRIVHAHIADHAHGHFCDLPVGRIHLVEGAGLEENWAAVVRFVKTLATGRPADLPQFRGLVSCELEAARSFADVLETVQQTRKIFNPWS